jgi:hypothetical protein
MGSSQSSAGHRVFFAKKRERTGLVRQIDSRSVGYDAGPRRGELYRRRRAPMERFRNMTLTPLQRHIMRTYFALRGGLIALALILPVGLPLLGSVEGIPYQHSLSAYYHAHGARGDSLRDLFVGLLFAVAALLYLYKGYSRWEDRLLNAAAAFAVGVALVPMEWPEALPYQLSVDEAVVRTASMHGSLAVAFFLCIAAVCLFCSGKTLGGITDVQKRLRYRHLYRVLGAIMVTAPLAAYVGSWFVSSAHKVIFVESAGVLAFGAYWFVKTIELKQSNAEQNALAGNLNLPVEPASLNGPAHDRPVVQVDATSGGSA